MDIKRAKQEIKDSIEAVSYTHLYNMVLSKIPVL